LAIDSLNKKTKEKPNKTTHQKILWWKPWLSDTALHKMADFEIAEKLSQRNYDVSLVIPTTRKKIVISKDKKFRVISAQMKFLPLISPAARCFLTALFLPLLIITKHPDYIIEEPDISILGFLPTIILCKIKRIKLVLDIRSVPVETFGFQGFMINLWFVVSISVCKNFFNGMTVITPLMKDELCCRFDLKIDRIGVWTSGVSMELFEPSISASCAVNLKNMLGLSSKFIVFYHGKFSPSRGLIETVKAMKKLKAIYPNITLFLLGSGPINDELKDLIKKEELVETVIIHDPVDQRDVPQFISMCDAAIVPLPNNQFWRYQSPLKLLEYLAMAKSTIVTDIPAHRSIIGENKCGIYFSSIIPEYIAAAIEYAYLNQMYLVEWGKTGRKIAKDYSWDNIAADLDNYLLSIRKQYPVH
jgi:glycosyltransferase involved in cell wall biosynthesis